ncbi:hypothetical protein JRO89_XS08G0121900 [Xanthoceras sorbifolium]|uniref:Carotenoid cleavage dioxygenase 7 n=1 Tax=Xanthoceras sorbifolium TaxID=99658 RepID=A0ABQ8HPQ5_9ROSI|nr:hypothetical protein JRO89_XS08G0121900 [Xanthoceras sorbifolium]
MHVNNGIRCRIIPTKFLSPVSTLPLVRRVTPSLAKPPLVEPVTISTPGTDTRVQTRLADDSTASAFWDYQFLFVSQRSESAEPVSLRAVDGAVPPDFPSGTYYLAGPGMFSDDHGSKVHPLDGHGYLRAFEIDGVAGEVRFMARYVKTEARVEEHDPESDTWRFTYRGPFSVLKGGKMLGNTKVMKNVANTSVVRWGGRLLCLWEGGAPYEIESRSLDTVDRFDLIQEDGDSDSGRCVDGGNNINNNHNKDGDMWSLAAKILKPILHGVFKMPPKRMLSHYKLDPRRNRLLIVACNAEDMLLPRSNFTFYEYDSNFKLVQEQEFEIPDHLMIHDWAFTDTHYILFANRIKLDVIGSMAAVGGLSPMISALSVNPSKPTSPIYLLPRFPADKCGSCIRISIDQHHDLSLLQNSNREVSINLDSDGNCQKLVKLNAISYPHFELSRTLQYRYKKEDKNPSKVNLVEGDDIWSQEVKSVILRIDKGGEYESNAMVDLLRLNKPKSIYAINPMSVISNSLAIAFLNSSIRLRLLPRNKFPSVMKLSLLSSSLVLLSSEGNNYFAGSSFLPDGPSLPFRLLFNGQLNLTSYEVCQEQCSIHILGTQSIGCSEHKVCKLVNTRPNIVYAIGRLIIQANYYSSIYHGV